MATLGALVTSISLRLLDENNTAVSTASIVDTINTSIRKWKYESFWFNEARSDIALTIDNPVLTLPSDFLQEEGKFPLVIVYNKLRYKINKVSPDVYDGQNVESSSIPCIYTYRANQVLLYPYPDQAYTLKLTYLKDYTAFATDGSDDSETNDFLTNAEDLIKYDALARLHGELRQDEKMETYYSARALDEKKTLKSKTHSFKATGRLKTEQIL